MFFQHESSLLLSLSSHWWCFTQQVMNFYGNLITFQLEAQANKQQHWPWPGWQGATSGTSSQKSHSSLNRVYDKGQSLQNLHTWLDELSQWLNLSSACSMPGQQTREWCQYWKLMEKYSWARYHDEERKQIPNANQLNPKCPMNTFNVFQLNPYLKLFDITPPI